MIWNKGKKLGYVPKTAFKKGQNLGDRHPNWKGGLWCWAKNKVIKRDKGVCQICGLNEPDIMDVAHIKPAGGDYKRKYTPQDIKNLITLCPNDHRRFDKKLIQLNNSAHLKLS